MISGHMRGYCRVMLMHTRTHTLPEVERNLAVDNIQTLNYWGRLNDMFPVVVNGGYDTLHDLTQMESMMYRWVCLSVCLRRCQSGACV